MIVSDGDMYPHVLNTDVICANARTRGESQTPEPAEFLDAIGVALAIPFGEVTAKLKQSALAAGGIGLEFSWYIIASSGQSSAANHPSLTVDAGIVGKRLGFVRVAMVPYLAQYGSPDIALDARMLALTWATGDILAFAGFIRGQDAAPRSRHARFKAEAGLSAPRCRGGGGGGGDNPTSLTHAEKMAHESKALKNKFAAVDPRGKVGRELRRPRGPPGARDLRVGVRAAEAAPSSRGALGLASLSGNASKCDASETLAGHARELRRDWRQRLLRASDNLSLSPVDIVASIAVPWPPSEFNPADEVSRARSLGDVEQREQPGHDRASSGAAESRGAVTDALGGEDRSGASDSSSSSESHGGGAHWWARGARGRGAVERARGRGAVEQRAAARLDHYGRARSDFEPGSSFQQTKELKPSTRTAFRERVRDFLEWASEGALGEISDQLLDQLATKYMGALFFDGMEVGEGPVLSAAPRHLRPSRGATKYGNFPVTWAASAAYRRRTHGSSREPLCRPRVLALIGVSLSLKDLEFSAASRVAWVCLGRRAAPSLRPRGTSAKAPVGLGRGGKSVRAPPLYPSTEEARPAAAQRGGSAGRAADGHQRAAETHEPALQLALRHARPLLRYLALLNLAPLAVAEWSEVVGSRPGPLLSGTETFQAPAFLPPSALQPMRCSCERGSASGSKRAVRSSHGARFPKSWVSKQMCNSSDHASTWVNGFICDLRSVTRRLEASATFGCVSLADCASCLRARVIDFTPGEAPAGWTLPGRCHWGLRAAERWFEKALEAGAAPNLVTFNALIDAAAQEGNLAVAQNWAWRLFRTELGCNLATYEGVIGAAARFGSMAPAENWFSRAVRSGEQPELSTFNAVLRAVAKDGSVHDAEKWFRKALASSIEPDVETFNCMVQTAARCSDPLAAENWFKTMIKTGISPTHDSFAAIMTAAAKSGDMALTEFWFDECVRAGVRPREAHFQICMQAALEAQDPRSASRWAVRAREDLRLWAMPVLAGACGSCKPRPQEDPS
ncbi:unnamed protein product [Prorocentrum cordatum]|uniref:Pentatricopeptide repeat-containing protein n=1 Tax=Prorocentrum cordatum TaxID=2364126 RepID=A0ABN9W4M8_9DINO|nr:unnamed protein product [Polarella glacialis]